MSKPTAANCETIGPQRDLRRSEIVSVYTPGPKVSPAAVRNRIKLLQGRVKRFSKSGRSLCDGLVGPFETPAAANEAILAGSQSSLSADSLSTER